MPVHHSQKYSCQACDLPDDDQMVACDKCNSWWHYACVGVGDSVSERDFVCRKCAPPQTTPDAIEDVPSEAGCSRGGSMSSSRARARLSMQRLAEQKALMEQQLELEQRDQERRHEQEKLQKQSEIEKKKLQLTKEFMEEKFRVLEQELDDEEDDRRSRKSQQSSISKVNQWRKEQLLGGKANSTMVTSTQETAPHQASTSTAAVGDSGVTITQSQVPSSSTVPCSLFPVSQPHFPLGSAFCTTTITGFPVTQSQVPVGINAPSASRPQLPSTVVSSTAALGGNAPSASQAQLRSTGMTSLSGVGGKTFNLCQQQLPSTVVNASAAVAGVYNVNPQLSLGVVSSFGVTGASGDAIIWSNPSGMAASSSALAGPSNLVSGVANLQLNRLQVSEPTDNSKNKEYHRTVVTAYQTFAPVSVVNDSHRPICREYTVFRDPIVSHMVPESEVDTMSNPELISSQSQFNMSVSTPVRTGNYQQAEAQRTPGFFTGGYPPPNLHAYSPQPQAWGPEPQQLAARQVMPRDLPVFSGSPEDWPIFISSYNNSTQACGYTNAENLVRLQRSLKGHALEAVRSRLLLPEAVPQVINTLYTLYGRPEVLIYMLLKKVREVPSPKPERLDTLIGFGMAVQHLCDHLTACKQEAHLNNPTLLFELIEKLPANFKLDWAMYKRQFVHANLQTFSHYMSNIVTAATDVTIHFDTKLFGQSPKQDKPKNFLHAHSAEHMKAESYSGQEPEVPVGKQCFVCKDPNHTVKDCGTFQKLCVDDRWKMVQKLYLCRICLFAHGKRPCKSKKRCEVGGCEFRHHPLLHSPPKRNQLSKSISANVNSHHYVGRSSLFRIIPVTLYGNGRVIKTFAFLDDGSSVTLVEDAVAELLGVEGEGKTLCLTWTSGVTRIEHGSKKLSLDIAGSDSLHKYNISGARTVKSLGLPQQTLRYHELVKRYSYLKGLPMSDYENVVPRILIGNDNAHLGVALKKREGKFGEPIALKTRLGWSVYGPTDGRTATENFSLHICECSPSIDFLHDLVKQYFSLESLGISLEKAPEPENDQRARRLLDTTTNRVGQRYETGLLWKYDDFEFPDSYPMAFKRMLCLERRMKSDAVVGASVSRQMREYQQKGYIHRATEAELNEADPRRTWYLPLGVIVNPKKPSKIRIFCDAAAKVEGVCLNSMLMKGPDLLVSLPAVLSGFRERNVAICADIREMFHQIQIRKPDRHAQRILWRDDPSQEPQIFLMDVATFGSTSSPCSAQYVKNRNASEHADHYPQAADAIVRKHYVDDYLDSVDSEDEAVQRAQEVKFVHSRGGFEIRSWLSNSEEVMRRVGETRPAEEKSLILDRGSGTERILGMLWLPKEDAFTYSSILPEYDWPTKREVLRTVMSLFDPLGLLSHFVVHGKILIQDVWRSKTNWDEKISEQLNAQWKKWTALFCQLDTVRIPRCYFPGRLSAEIESVELHVFVDASEKAYACVAYLRAIVAGEVQCSLVAAKSKVAPLKPLSIPRLELQAAVIGVRLMTNICAIHSLPITQRYIWTDSKVTYIWVNAEQRLYRKYVDFRVGEIRSKTNLSEWRWLPSKLNVADEATKWGSGPNLSPSSRWFRGPEFLYEESNCWPSQKIAETETSEELKTCMSHHQQLPEQVVNWERFSQWKRLLRTVGYVHRFVHNLKQKRGKLPLIEGALTQEELAAAEGTIFRLIQKEDYPNDVAVMVSEPNSKRTRKQWKKESSSKLSRLCPFADENGVLRMESRIGAAAFASFDTRNPIILPREHYVIRLLVRWYHLQYYHSHGETVVNEIRQRFHISNLRAVVRRIAKECFHCRVKHATPAVPRMAPLPAARLGVFTRPFSYVGVDYFGPLQVTVGRSTVKRWVALFTCLTVRAVHLEVVHSLSTKSCKMAVRRFIARRGAPVEIYSDNGTNFVGASNELRKECRAINGHLAETFTNAQTRWLFNPPSAPHMGGAWEGLVRSVKSAFAAMTYTKNPDEETFATVVVEAEAVVNSRPLTFIPLESECQEALTPNHFLLMSSSGVAQPRKTALEPKEACRNSWNLCRHMVDLFWHRWIKEYLPTITRRTKWFKETEPLRVGDLVIVVDQSVRNGWTRGRVLEVLKAKDGRVRQAEVKTSVGILRRPVVKLARLDLRSSKTGEDLDDQCYGPGDVTECHTDPLFTDAEAPRSTEAK